MSATDVILLILIIVGALGAGLYFLNRWTYRRMNEQQEIVQKSKMAATIYVIDKKRDKPGNANLPKIVTEKLPRMYRYMKMPLVKAKVGPQIMTLMCDRKVYDALPVKKNVKVEIAGIYIVEMKGMKTKAEMKALRESRKGTADAQPEKWYEKYNPMKLFKK